MNAEQELKSFKTEDLRKLRSLIDGRRRNAIQLIHTTRLCDQDFPAGTTLHLFAEGTLDWASLGAEMVVRPQNSGLNPIPAHQRIAYYRNGHLKEAVLASSTVLQDHLFLADTIVHFSNEGRLVWTQVSGPTSFVVGSQPLMARDHSCVEFHRTGSVRALTLAQVTIIQGHRFDADCQVKFDPSACLAMAHIPNEAEPHAPASETVVRFERSGIVKEITVT